MKESNISIIQNSTAVVLAGGQGKRVQALFPGLPKPLVPAAGKPFLFWVTMWLAKQGAHDIIYSIGYRGEQISAWCKTESFPPRLSIRTCAETYPLGTGGAIVNCLPLIGDLLLVLNGDSLLLADLTVLEEAFVRAGSGAAILGSFAEDASRFGSLDVDSSGWLKGFREKQPGTGLINAGIYLFRKSVLLGFPKDKPLSVEYDIIPSLLGSGVKIGVAAMKGAPFLDIGTPQTVLEASSFIRKNFDRYIA